MSSPLAIMKGLTSPIAPAVAVVVAAAVAAHDALELRTSDRAASLTGRIHAVPKNEQLEPEKQRPMKRNIISKKRKTS